MTTCNFEEKQTNLMISGKVTSLGVLLEKHLSFDDQIDHVCKSSINHLRNSLRIRRYLDVNAPSTVIHAVITKRLDYCNHLYFGLPKYNKVPTNAEHCCSYISLCQEYEHITPVLAQLHWLPVSYRIVFKDLFVYKSVNGLCPQYLTEHLDHWKSTRSLC